MLRADFMTEGEIAAYLAPPETAHGLSEDADPGWEYPNPAWLALIPPETWRTGARLWRAMNAEGADPTGRAFKGRVYGHDAPWWLLPGLVREAAHRVG